MPTDTGVADEEEGPPMCELEGGEPIDIKMAPACRQEDFEVYDRWFKVVGAVDSSWEVDACTQPNCGGCVSAVEPPLTLTFSPIQVANLADVESCLRVRAHRRYPVNPDACEYHTAVVWDHTVGNIGVPILIARNDPNVAMPVLDAVSLPALAGFVPELVVDEQCSCDIYPGDCCDGVDPGPTVYEFGIGAQNTVPIDGKETLNFDVVAYEFWAFDAFETGICDEPPHVSWALTRK